MKTIAMTMVSLVGLTGLALAGDPPKAGGAAATKAPAAEAKTMEMPKPAPEIAEMVKNMAGTWKCTGTGNMGTTEMKFTGTMKSKADLDGFWIHDSFEGNMGEGKAAMKFKFEGFMTYDASQKKWRNVMVDNWGGQMTGWSDGMKDGKMDVASDTIDMMGKGQFKDHTDASDPKKGVHMWGEESRDGKTWNKAYDMMCKK